MVFRHILFKKIAPFPYFLENNLKFKNSAYFGLLEIGPAYPLRMHVPQLALVPFLAQFPYSFQPQGTEALLRQAEWTEAL